MSQSDLTRIEVIDQLCDHFESQWNGDHRPSVSEYVDAADVALRPSLLSELLVVEWELRATSGERPDLAEYLRRFPQWSDIVVRAYEHHQRWLEQRRLDAPDSAASTRATRHAEWPTFGRYQTCGILGVGAMGVVFLGRDSTSGREVAIKAPRPHLAADPEVLSRFRREANAIRNVLHRHLCPIYEVGEQGEIPYLVMKRIVGRTLAQVLAQERRFTQQRSAAFTLKLAGALGALHERDGVHRDLKPANVMIDGDGEPMLIDFGLARLEETADARLTQPGAIVGSPVYMAPEQLRGAHDEMGPWTDLYSLGVLLFEMLTGEVPYRGSPREIIDQRNRGEARSLRTLRADVDDRLVAICEKLLADRPAERYPHAAALVEALNPYLLLEPNATTEP